MENLQADCFGGTTFHAANNIQTNIKKGTVSIHGKFVVKQDNSIYNIPLFPPPTETTPVGCVRSRNISSTPSSSNLYSNVKSGADQVNFNAISLPTDNVVDK